MEIRNDKDVAKMLEKALKYTTNLSEIFVDICEYYDTIGDKKMYIIAEMIDEYIDFQNEIDAQFTIKELVGFSDHGMYQKIRKKYPEVCISVDTFRADIANIPIEDAIELVYELGAVPENTAVVEEAVDQVLKSTKTIQKLRDKARVTNKLVRSEVRYTNAIEALLEELNDKLKSTVFSEIPKVAHGKVGDNVGLVQISDLHLNEVVDLVDTINYNKFNYDIACRRLKKFHDEIVVNLKSHNVNKVVVVNSGDVLNSDRRLDEILTNAGTRSIALIVAVDILSQFIRDLSSEFSVSYATVLGNESRKFEELTWSNKTFSNNYDFEIKYTICSSCGICFFFLSYILTAFPIVLCSIYF